MNKFIPTPSKTTAQNRFNLFLKQVHLQMGVLWRSAIYAVGKVSDTFALQGPGLSARHRGQRKFSSCNVKICFGIIYTKYELWFEKVIIYQLVIKMAFVKIQTNSDTIKIGSVLRKG